MAESTFKRVLTDEICDDTRASDQPSQASGISNELYLQLKNVGRTARKNVLEGYRTCPSPFAKAQSTGSIFRSNKDIIQEVYGNSSTLLASASTSHSATSRKRARAVSESEPSDLIEDSEMAVDNYSESVTAPPPAAVTLSSSRPIKPLRNSSRAFLETRSLPTGLLLFSAPSQTPSAAPTTEETDWSEDAFAQQSAHDLDPMIFE